MTRPTTLLRDDAALRVSDTGDGLAVVFQHGLGGGEAQVAQAFPSGSGSRRITLECRGHGASGLGTSRPFSLEMFADDVVAAADQAGLDRFVAGGISMGAAIALRLACRHPDRVAGLLLVRPAWIFDSAPANLRPIAEVAGLILDLGPEKARTIFTQSKTAARLKREAPDNLASLFGYFDRPDAAPFAQVLADIAADGPGVSANNAAALGIPTLVIGNAMDAVHPLPAARTLAAAIPGATFAEISPKALDSVRHFAELQAEITTFLHAHFNFRSLVPS
ncbi:MULTISPECIES: alpha/beta hydrolase [unclassified Mesorhizobium]|uniref:alpha/beta fold hydrolase n=1 Tax=unclassified Mesorhizobium TaxID=325217 RepID=UPI000FC9E511|nr:MULTISPECIES: alpha/beta hydrolase [unclassified Mesorhizobium]RUU32348.1 alpha/beta hydrolase [Mesorhizobium sp. M6A.T.Ce.TU.016.01.1.1]RVB75820.1 alpha/beta hydrolase [Mesorhizobium sp. M6A.T.Cr.TU.014.01.1.1]RWP79396.1 MAG: alpha/beta hydrolase [Mesorhizobium sp.]RWQ03413.1 MAG: alpha/beta hydrolase [Mesorhizobium sp.]RWQ04273.1 MAG: alpha/beta hydrolase [Mesorhizobium sp.]